MRAVSLFVIVDAIQVHQYTWESLTSWINRTSPPAEVTEARNMRTVAEIERKYANKIEDIPMAVHKQAAAEARVAETEKCQTGKNNDECEQAKKTLNAKIEFWIIAACGSGEKNAKTPACEEANAAQVAPRPTVGSNEVTL